MFFWSVFLLNEPLPYGWKENFARARNYKVADYSKNLCIGNRRNDYQAVRFVWYLQQTADNKVRRIWYQGCNLKANNLSFLLSYKSIFLKVLSLRRKSFFENTVIGIWGQEGGGIEKWTRQEAIWGFSSFAVPVCFLFDGAVWSSHMYWLVSQRVRGGVVDTELHHKMWENYQPPKNFPFSKYLINISFG